MIKIIVNFKKGEVFSGHYVPVKPTPLKRVGWAM